MKKTVSSAASKGSHWAESRHKDIIIYLLVAIFLLELAVGGASAIYGIMHAEPVEPGGPPLPRFPWLGWGLSALLLPVGLLLILHLSGLLVARTLERPAGGEQGADGQTPGQPSGQTAASPLPPHVERFYSIVRHAPTVVILLSLLIFGGLLLFVDGLMETLGRLGGALQHVADLCGGWGNALTMLAGVTELAGRAVKVRPGKAQALQDLLYPAAPSVP